MCAVSWMNDGVITVSCALQMVLSPRCPTGSSEQLGSHQVCPAPRHSNIHCRWHSSAHLFHSSVSCSRFPRESNHLIDLPCDYSALINQASSFTWVTRLMNQRRLITKSCRFSTESCSPDSIRQIIDLLLILAWSRCPKSGGDKSRAPTLCLVCGTMLCSQSYCCQTELEGEDVGACTAHTFACGAGVGIFLRFVQGCRLEPVNKMGKLFNE